MEGNILLLIASGKQTEAVNHLQHEQVRPRWPIETSSMDAVRFP